jgi:hypothetical protein
MRKIPLRNRQKEIVAETLIDNEDYAAVAAHSWFRNPTGYAQRSVWIPGLGVGVILMHRLIAGAPKGMWVDHVNRNRLDNRRGNLRVCTPQQNACNRLSPNGDGMKGATFDRSVGRWRARICRGTVCESLGYFPSHAEAKAAYDRRAREIDGDYFRA